MWKEGFCNECGKIVCKDFFSPYIIEPIHGNQVAKPHVGGFMGYKLCTTQFFIRCGMFIKKHLAVVVQGSPRMFHASILKSWKDNKIIFSERIGDVRIFFEPV